MARKAANVGCSKVFSFVVKREKYDKGWKDVQRKYTPSPFDYDTTVKKVEDALKQAA